MYQTVTIQVGNTAYIPSGAKVVATTTTGDATPSSDCIDLTGEPLNCYAFISAAQNDQGGHTEPFQNNNIDYTGLIVNNQEYLFPTAVAWQDAMSDLPGAIQALPGIGQLFLDIIMEEQDDGDYGFKQYIVFKTVPSIATGLRLSAKTHLFFEGDSDMYYDIKVADYAEAAANNDNFPLCTDNSNPNLNPA